METNDTYFDLIEDYLEGLLSEEDKKAFELKLESNNDLKERFQKHQEAHRLLELGAGNFLKEKLEAMNPNSQKISGKIVSFPRYVWALAAVILVLIMVLGVFNVKNDYSDQALFNEYVSPYATGPVRGANNPTEWTDGSKAYLNKDYQASIENFSKIKEDSPRFVESRFFLGSSALLAKDYALALSSLEKVIENKDQRFMAAAEWYQVLAFFGMGNEETSRVLAEKIFKEQNHAYQDHATRFLSDLDSFWR